MFTPKNALVVVFAFASQANMLGFVQGQDILSVPPAKAPAGESSKVMGMFKGKEPVDPAAIKRYVQNEFVRLTNPADTAGYANIRTTLLTTIRNASVEAAKKAAADQVIVIAKAVAANPKYHPHARINAMLALSELDLESNMPYIETFGQLVTVAKDENQSLQMRAIALFGLNRHAKLSKLTPAYADGLAKTMATIVASQPKTVLDVKAHAWIVRRSFDVLTSLGAAHAVEPAIARLLNDKELPSVRLAAADYLPRVDNSKLADDKKIQYFIGLAQLLEQQLVNWYEFEEDTLKMKSGAASTGSMGGGMGGGRGMGGGMGSMGDMGDGGMGMGDGGMGGMGGMGMGGEGGMGMGDGGMGGMGMGGMGGMGNANKPKPIETQPWEVRLTRRQVNQLLQTVHVALDAKPIKGARPVSANAKGLIDLGLPAAVSEPASDLLKAVESLQNRVNDSTKITTMNSLLAQTKKQIENVMDSVREIPALTAQYPKYQVVKDDLKDVQETPKGDAPKEGAGGEGGEAPAAGGGAAGNAANPPAEGN